MENSQFDYKNIKIKTEPLSPPHRNNSTGLPSLTKGQGTRLPSFKPPRDLSLGGSGISQTGVLMKGLLSPLTKASKKVYAPNLNVVRKKSQSIETLSDIKNVSSPKMVKPNIKDKKNVNRNKPTYVQTHGIFSEGLAPGKVKAFQNNAGSGGGGSETTYLEKPKLNLNTKISKKKEDSKMKDLMKDDFIDDPKNGPDLSYIPFTLPRVYNVKSELNDSHDIDKTFESLQVKTEIVKKEEPPDDMHEILDIFQKTDKPTFLLFEFPRLDVGKEDDMDDRKKKSSSKTAAVDNETTVPKGGMFAGLGEGLWGFLKIHANGLAYFVVGDKKIPVTLTRHNTRQDIMSARVDTSVSKGEVINMGTIQSTFTCSTNFQQTNNIIG